MVIIFFLACVHDGYGCLFYNVMVVTWRWNKNLYDKVTTLSHCKTIRHLEIKMKFVSDLNSCSSGIGLTKI